MQRIAIDDKSSVQKQASPFIPTLHATGLRPHRQVGLYCFDKPVDFARSLGRPMASHSLAAHCSQLISRHFPLPITKEQTDGCQPPNCCTAR